MRGTPRVPDEPPSGNPSTSARLAISGYHGAPTPAVLLVTRFDRGQRTRRAVKALGGFWGAMVVSVFIPIAHFLLVPSFFGIGIYQCLRRLRVQEQVRGVHGACPDCGVEQDFELGSRAAFPQSVQCRSCHRGLTLATVEARAS